MIFKTITDEATGATKSISIFNSTLSTMQRNLASGQGAMYSIFGGNTLRKNDVTTLNNYVNGIKSGLTPAQSWMANMKGCSVAAKQYVLDARKAGKSTRELSADLKTVSTTSKVASIGLKALSIAGNMLLFTAITKGIQILSDAIDEVIVTNEEYLEQQDEIISKQDEIISSTESEITSLEELKEKIKDTNGKKEELLKLSSDIESVLGKESTELLDQSNAYDLLNAKIQDNINLRKQEQEEANKEKKRALRDTVENAVIENEGLGESVTFEDLKSYGFQGGQNVQAIFDDLVKDARNNEDFTNSVEEYAELWRKAVEKAQANMPNAIELGLNGQYDIFGGSMPSEEEIKSVLNGQIENVLSYFEEEINSGKGFLSSERLKQAVKQMWLEGYDFGDISEGLDGLLSTNSITEAWDAYATAVAENSEDKDVLYNDFIAKVDRLKASQPYAENIITDYVNHLYTTLETAIEDEETKKYDLFSNIFNAEDFEESAKALKELAISGELSPETLSSTKEYIQLLKDTGLSAEDAVERIREFALGETSLSNIMSTIQSTSSLINDVESDINEHGEITFDNLQKIADQFPSLEQNIRDYLNGVEGAEDELVNKLKDCYKQDLKNYDQYYEAKQGNDDVWWSNFLTNSSDLVNKLKDNYDIDLANFSTYLLAKEKMQALIDENESKVDDWSVGIGSIMPDPLSVGGYYQGKADELKAYLEEIQKTFKDSVGTSDLDALEDYTSGDKYDSGSDKDSSSTFDWIDTQISNMEDSLDELDKQVSDTYSKWDTRNQKLAESIAKTNEAIKLQDNAAKAYMNEANSLGISSHYKTLVQKGALNIEDISDKDLADKIKDYQDLYEKSVECTKKAEELKQTLNELSSSEKWDLLKSESDADIDILDKRIDAIQTSLDKLDLNGMFANSSYYSDMVDLTQSKIDSLISQEKELQNILNTMTSGTEAYDTMFAELMDIRNQIVKLENDCIEFNNNIRDLDWEIFEFFEDSISRITEEINFFKDLLSDEDMFDDNGNMTKYADATIGLHYASIETYKKQAQDYYEEMQELQQQLVNGAGQDVLEKYREYEDLHRDMVLAIQDEQKAVLDLVQNGYEEQLKILQEINQATLDRMDAERDLYNFQKDIEEKTQEKTSIERQIDVLRGDNSEEAKSKLQQLEVKLSDVNADIEETLYEQQRNDTQAMLDDLESSYQEWMNIRMDDENALLEEIRGEVETKSNDIITTLKEVAGEYGTTLSTSLTDIFGSEKPFDNVVTAIEKLVDRITGLVGVDGSGSGNSSNGSSGSNGSTSTNTTPTTSTTTTSSTNTQQTSNTQSKSATDGIFIYQKSVYPKSKLDKEKSVVDRLKYFDFASDFSSRATYYKKLGGSGTYTGSSSQNRWFISKMKEMGYASGTNYAKKGLHWTQENGDELIIRKSDGAVLTPLGMGDKVVNAEGTNNLFTFANDPQGFLEKFGVLNYTPNLALPKMPIFQPRSSSNEVNLGGVHIAQVVANNPTEFTQQLKVAMANDRNVQKMVQELSFGQGLGNNTMNVKKYL